MLKKGIFIILSIFSFQVKADDGYRLWLKYDLLKNATKIAEYKQFCHFVDNQYPSALIVKTAEQELRRGISGLLGISFSTSDKKNGGIIFKKDLTIPSEGFRIEENNGNIIIAAQTDKGILYGVYELLRHIQTEQSISKINFSSSPTIQLRMLNHWDNVLGTIERGYAGSSLWKWYELPENIDPRYQEYARANASIGINAVVLNNVNASARFLTKEYLVKVKALSDVFRPYGIQVFLSINFASPKILGKLKTSDPLDPKVIQWWHEKANEVYSIIPDFGGFLVKANSEGEPGPQEFGRTHADGANMLATALKPHNGLVIWRTFVYSPNPKSDRFKEAYNEFKPLDGHFAQNVIVQVKNGPIDFMPREPFHPLFGAMPKTPLALEFQITQEYLGFSTNMVYLPSLFKEVLSSDTYVNGSGSEVAKIVDGALHNYPITAIAGVANTGSDRNWTGHLMSQANWYGFGRLAWNHEISPDQIADEWIKMTLTRDKKANEIIKEMLLKSREIYVNFTNPLGLHHIMGQNIHFGMEPWLEKSARPDWTAVYYHRADSVGIGFDRTSNGSNALGLYTKEVQDQWNNPNNCDLKYILWFHHVPWNQKLSTGRTLWDELCTRYYSGVNEVETLQNEWLKVKGVVDDEIFEDVKGRLATQHREALNWRDACVLYFQTFSKQPIPKPFVKPSRTLEEMKSLVEIYQLK